MGFEEIGVVKVVASVYKSELRNKRVRVPIESEALRPIIKSRGEGTEENNDQKS